MLSKLIEVSIQLISPASGEFYLTKLLAYSKSFHSTNFPSEWGRYRCLVLTLPPSSFHSTNFPSEWGDNFIERLKVTQSEFPFN